MILIIASIFAFNVLATGTGRLFATDEFAQRIQFKVDHSRRDLAYARYTSRPLSHQNIQCHDYAWWDDGANWGCEEWEAYDLCTWDLSQEYREYGFTVDDACCACGGGIREYGCSDAVANWHDSDGSQYTCDWYATTSNACNQYGHDFENFGHTASTACCACGGGNTGVWNSILNGRRQLSDDSNADQTHLSQLSHRLTPHTPSGRQHHMPVSTYGSSQVLSAEALAILNVPAPAAGLSSGSLSKRGGRRSLDVSEATLGDVLSKMKTAFGKMFPESLKPTWAYEKQYNFAEFTKAFKFMFKDFDFTQAVPDPSCAVSDPCFTGHSNTVQTTTRAANIKRIVAFLWAHVKQETGGLKYLNEAACSSTTTDSVCCSYNTGTCLSNTASDSKYFGRGSLQLSWKSNYENFGKWTNGLDEEGMHASAFSNFVGHADKLTSASYAWLSGMWYFTNAKMHICGSSGTEDIVQCFQRTTQKINGAQECSSSSTTNQNEDKTRLDYLIQAYKALNDNTLNGIPKTSAEITFFNSRSDITVNRQTCDFCGNAGTDCTNEDNY